MLANNYYDGKVIINALLGRPIFREREMKRNVFISYNHSGEAKAFVPEISQKLKSLGLKVWLDSEEIKFGDSISESINKALEQSSYVIALVGPDDKQSPWATKELDIALAKGKPIIPVMINNAKVSDLPEKISDYLAIDISNDKNNLVKVYESIDRDRGIWDRLREYIIND